MLLRKCKYLIRKCQFQELSAQDITGAMAYLQNDLASVIDHNNMEEKKEVGLKIKFSCFIFAVCDLFLLYC